jgi:hypothetical protein
VRYNLKKTTGHGEKSAYQNDTQKETAEAITTEYGVSPATVKRAGNQLGRRNLTRDQWEYLLGVRYNRIKRVQGQEEVSLLPACSSQDRKEFDRK